MKAAAARDDVAARVPLYGTSLVEAGAGTGKTHTIVSLYVRLLLERGLSVSQILVVTYTVAATAELRERIRSRLVQRAERGGEDGERCREAVRSFDRAAVFSIHGFCQRALREHAFESGGGFESELVSDSQSLLEEVAQDFWSARLHAAPRFQVDYARSQGIVPSRLAELAGKLAARPDAELRPARPAVPDLGALLAEWRVAQSRAAKLWAAESDEVLGLLVAAAERKELNGNSYRPSTIRGAWRLVLDEEMRRGEPGIRRRFEYVERLTTSGMRPNKGCRPPEHRFFDRCEELVRADERLDEALAAWVAALRHDFADYARSELARRKQERDVLFFDDLLQGLRDALRGEGGPALAAAIRRRYPVALIDEFQDTDPIQYETFRRVWHEGGAECALLLIGDPKQAIYGFRGADVLAYLEARGDAGDARYGLRCNRRADPGLVAALNALFASRESPFARDEIPFEPALPRPDARDVLVGSRISSGLRFLLARSPDGTSEIPTARDGGPLIRAIAGEVVRILAGDQRIDGRPLAAGDVAVLTRTNRQARAVQAALREHGVVSVLQSEESVFATHEARELERVMRAMSEPGNPARMRAALATPLLSTSADDLQALADEAAGEGWDEWTARMRAARQIWIERGILQALRFLWVEAGVGARLLARPDGERRATNLLHLGELLQRASLEERLGPQALLYRLGRRRHEAEGSTSALVEDVQLRLESDAHAVQLLTIHRSKGLQYPVTICPFLWDGMRVPRSERVLRFHDPVTGALVLDAARGSLEASEDLSDREAHEENLRLLYVALTRAKHHCSVVWGRFKEADRSPLAHLLHATGLGDLKTRKDDQLRADLEAVASRAPEHIEILDWTTTPPPLLPRLPITGAPESRDPASLVAERARRRYGSTWRVSSFTGLVAEAPVAEATGPLEPRGVASEDGRDYDSVAPADAAGSAGAAGGAGDDEVRLAAFPAGAMPGILVHEIFERLDFPAALSDPDGIASLVGAQLERRGFAARWQPSLTAAVRDVLAVPLAPEQTGSHLGAIPRCDRIDEMEFVLPVASREPAASPLTARGLARAFREHAEAPFVRRYAERAQSLGFADLRGHLRGFLDLVFRRNGRWSVVDYKSNHLGPSRGDYRAEALEDAMFEHDYVLQYHLYLVALHRYLGLRLPGYDYDRHVEGAFYLFLRGMSPDCPPGWGIVRDRPPRALVEALSECLS